MRVEMKSNWILVALLASVGVLTGCQGLGTGGALQNAKSAKTSSTGGCPAPSSPGVVVCDPFTNDLTTNSTGMPSPVQVIASATASQGRVIQMQVVADGQKIAQAHGARFDAAVTMSPGSHTLTVVARETGGSSLTSAPIFVQVFGSTAGQACPPPTSPGVNICSPEISGGTSCAVEPWFTFVASGTAQTGSVREMQLWMNGVDVANFPGNSLNTNFFFDLFGPMTIVEVDSKGQSISSPTIMLESAC